MLLEIIKAHVFAILAYKNNHSDGSDPGMAEVVTREGIVAQVLDKATYINDIAVEAWIHRRKAICEGV